MPWLTPEANELAVRHRMRNIRLHTRRFDTYVALVAGSRHIRLMSDQLDLIASDAGARMAHPFLDPVFLLRIRGLGRTPRARRPDRLSWKRSSEGYSRASCCSGRRRPRSCGSIWASPRAPSRVNGTAPACIGWMIDGDRLRAELLADTPPVGAALLAQWLWLSYARRGHA